MPLTITVVFFIHYLPFFYKNIRAKSKPSHFATDGLLTFVIGQTNIKSVHTTTTSSLIITYLLSAVGVNSRTHYPMSALCTCWWSCFSGRGCELVKQFTIKRDFDEGRQMRSLRK
jgi:hypothetical protein